GRGPPRHRRRGSAAAGRRRLLRARPGAAGGSRLPIAVRGPGRPDHRMCESSRRGRSAQGCRAMGERLAIKSGSPRMATPRKTKKSPYTADRSTPGAFEGESVTRRTFMTGGALAVGGIASAAFGLPALGFALGPNFGRTEPHRWQDVGALADFSDTTYTVKIVDL